MANAPRPNLSAGEGTAAHHSRDCSSPPHNIQENLSCWGLRDLCGSSCGASSCCLAAMGCSQHAHVQKVLQHGLARPAPYEQAQAAKEPWRQETQEGELGKPSNPSLRAHAMPACPALGRRERIRVVSRARQGLTCFAAQPQHPDNAPHGPSMRPPCIFEQPSSDLLPCSPLCTYRAPDLALQIFGWNLWIPPDMELRNLRILKDSCLGLELIREKDPIKCEIYGRALRLPSICYILWSFRSHTRNISRVYGVH